MNTTDINWSEQALKLLTGLFPVRRIKNVSEIRKAVTANLCQYSLAKQAVLVGLEDSISARVLYSTAGIKDAFIDVDIVNDALVSDSIVTLTDHNAKWALGQTLVVLPVKAIPLLSVLFQFCSEHLL